MVPSNIPMQSSDGHWFGWKPLPDQTKKLAYPFKLKYPYRVMATRVSWDLPEMSDQGNTPHCVGFAGLNFLNCSPVNDHLPNQKGHDFYYACKILDGEPGKENGSYVFSMATVLKDQLKRIDSFGFATTLADIKQFILTEGPLDIGTLWYAGMSRPDSSGLVHPTGQVVGGHSYDMNGYDPATDLFEFPNSWGLDFAIKGHFYMKANEWWQVFQDNGDACQMKEKPLTPEPPLPTGVEDAIRAKAKTQRLISINPDAALYKKAQALGLGAPIHNEAQIVYQGVTYIFQAYSLGKIVYCVKNDWGNVLVMER